MRFNPWARMDLIVIFLSLSSMLSSYIISVSEWLSYIIDTYRAIFRVFYDHKILNSEMPQDSRYKREHNSCYKVIT